MNINDLSVLLAAIDIAVKRGAFSVLEVGAVGQAAEKLNAFLVEATAQANAAAAEQAAAEGQPATDQVDQAPAAE
jgi:uncharacterized low-complexity protein